MKHTVDGLHSVASHDLTFTLKDKALHRKDEIGKIANAVYTLITSFKEIITNFMEASNKLNQGTNIFEESFTTISDNMEHINAAVEEVAKSAVSQADETKTANDKVTSMSSTLLETVEHIKGLNESCQKCKGCQSCRCYGQ